MPRGRPKGSKNKYKKYKIKSDVKLVRLTCNKCKKIKELHTTRPEIYTEEVRRNYICLFCKSKKRN